MKCENDRELITRWISHELAEPEKTVFEMHLNSCAECRQELKAAQQVWNLLGEMPVPAVSADTPVRFQTMLEEYKESQTGKKDLLAGMVAKLRDLWTLQPGIQLAYSLVLVMAGLGFGYFINQQGSSKQQIETLSSQVHEMKEMMMLSLLENPSASERMRGVSYTSEIKTTNKEVVDALFATLNNDPNVNVRLVTLEALTHFAGEASVREGLVQSIAQQDSPLLQSALADVMLKLQEKRAVKSFRKLLEQKDLNNSVRTKIEQTITGLI